jgi:DNA-binding transcriptional MerR regulator
VTIITSEKELDKEWVDLILEALNLGISDDEIREFLKQSSITT